jgi:cob(I)alamin adenosyltransferase
MADERRIDDAEAERHRAKMEKRKAVQDAEVAAKTVEKGLLIVNTGPGKGKSTAAFGLALRMLGYGRRVGVVQFIKGAWHAGEQDALARFGDLADPTISLVVLDELNIALRYDYLDVENVVAALKARREGLHVVVTGRNAKPALVDAADLVTEMGATKHHFAAGVKAQKGIEF